MSDEPPSGEMESRAERLANELQEFVDAEKAELDALAVEIRALRNSIAEPVIDRQKIWATIERALTSPAGDDERPR